MSALVDVWGDEERAWIDYLDERVADLPAELASTGVSRVLPEDWTVASPPHLTVACDAAPETAAWGGASLRRECTMRITAWADSPTRAKWLGRLAHAAALAYPARPGAGVLADQDPQLRAPFASFTVVADQRRAPGSTESS